MQALPFTKMDSTETVCRNGSIGLAITLSEEHQRLNHRYGHSVTTVGERSYSFRKERQTCQGMDVMLAITLHHS